MVTQLVELIGSGLLLPHQRVALQICSFNIALQRALDLGKGLRSDYIGK